MKETSKTTSTSPRELVITRVFDAPRELVFKAWTDQNHVAQWWGPKGFTNPLCKWEAKAGSTIRVNMQGPDGKVYPMGGAFREIIPPERLVFVTTAHFDDENKPILENLNTVTFEEYEGKTRLTLHVTVLKATPEAEGPLAGMKEGWSQSLDKLDTLVTKIRKKRG